MESIRQTFNGLADFGRKVSCTIARNGDMINRMYLQVTLPALADGERWTHRVGLALIKSVELEIGGQKIDKHYGEWLNIWNELSLPLDKRQGWQTMVGHEIRGVDSSNDNYWDSGNGAPQTTLYIPLEFWFCRNVGLALPLIALQYHEVKVKIEFDSLANCCDTPASFDNLQNVSLWVDYIFLDTDERRRFAQLSHEYLIEQLQFTGTETLNKNTNRIKLNFNHPCKELVWAIRSTDVSTVYWNNFSTAKKYGSGTDNDYYNSKNPTQQAKIMLNGNDRFSQRKGDYFSLVQPYQHHENTPDEFHKGINVYSFALKPEEHQPSGTLNKSRIDTAVLSLSSSVSGTIHIFAVNYNVLRILSGMGGLAYSN
jgi:hypothetical protein